MEEDRTTEQKEQLEKKQKPGVLSLLQTVLAAGIGVQTDKKRKEDFQQGSLFTYVILGILGVIVFIGSLVALVHMVIPET